MGSIKIWDFWADKYERLWVQKYSLSPTRREIIHEMRRVIKPDRAYRILDMGCGTGQLIREMKKAFKGFQISYMGVDVSPKMLERAKEQNKDAVYVNASAQDFSAPDGHFDIIVCSHSFPYYSDQEAVFNKFGSLLKEGGHLFLAQASVNTAYDTIAMFFVKFTTGSAKYLSVKKIKEMAKGKLCLLGVRRIKEKSYMPGIYLFVFKKGGKQS